MQDLTPLRPPADPLDRTCTLREVLALLEAAENHPYRTAPAPGHAHTEYADGWRRAVDHIRHRVYLRANRPDPNTSPTDGRGTPGDAPR